MDVGMYERALQRTGKVVAGTSRDQFDDSTPCEDWTVRDLLNHIIGGLLTFSTGAAGESRAMSDGTDHTAEDHVRAYDDAADGALKAFSEPGAMEQTFTLPWGETPGAAAYGLALADAVVHGWDLAIATGQEAVIDHDVAEAIYNTTSKMMEPYGPYPRGDSFGAAVEVPEDARPADKMLAYLGRQP